MFPPTQNPLVDPVGSPPDYAGDDFARPIDNANRQQITNDDSPEIALAHPADLTSIDVYESFRLYLVWAFPTDIIYTLATIDWQVEFRADTYVSGQGVTQLEYPNGIYSQADFTRNHDDPVVTAPDANSAVNWVL